MPSADIFDKNRLVQLLAELSEEQASEVYTFALFIKQRCYKETDTSKDISIKTLPISTLQALAGTVTWGGDAVQDTEHLYEL